jgi:Zn-dependent protease with chaperone function/uncharacterized tellurite resistance protein B-like protein
MDFFHRQEIARRNTRFLEVYFALAVIGTVVTIYIGAALIFFWQQGASPDENGNPVQLSDLWNGPLFLGVAVVTIGVIACGSIYKTASLASGGSAVAESLGGRPIDANTSDPDMRRLLNVVEEMSIASGTPIPQVYFLPQEEGINAFAAGHSTGDMVICVTAGALKYLNRDELQGVIGHEFSHILHGDMRLNLRLMGIIFGILCLAIIGRILLYTRGDRRNPLPLFGLVLIAVGSAGIFFSKLIKSAVSRQREFLADASSVQYTRNPAGLANALKKVGSAGSRIDDPNAEDASHFFFANGLTESFFGWMSTHPPLEERIRELDPAWDGKFIPLQRAHDPAPDSGQNPPPVAPPGFAGAMGNFPGAQILGGAAVLASSQMLPSIGVPTPRHLDYASDVMANLPPQLAEAARTPMSAVALIYALLLNRDEKIQNAQLQALQPDPAMEQETARLLPLVLTLDGKARLPLVTLAVTALRALSAAQYDLFSQNISALIAAGGQVDLFAYVLKKIVQRRLAPSFHPVAPTVPQYYALKPLLPDCALLISAVACAGQSELADVEKAFEQGRQALNVPADQLKLDVTAPYLEKIDAALKRLDRGAPQIKKAVLNACAATVAADGMITENEAELLRAIADTLDCPIPPFLNI